MMSPMKLSLLSPWVLLLLSGIVIASVYAILKPWNLQKLISHPHPAGTYDEALRRINALREKEAAVSMNPCCTLQFMSHGRKTLRTVVLVHGYTNCPQQFHELGKRFFVRGDNVLIAPLPYHGLADRMNTEQSRLKAADMASYADEVVDIGKGLGEKVVMMGISAGAVTTAWAAQNRKEIDCAVIISPTLGFKQVPAPLTAVLMNLILLLPDGWSWWNDDLKENVQPSYGYPRCSKHVIAEILRMGFVVEAEASRHRASARKIVMVFNPCDKAINEKRTLRISELWKKHGAPLVSYTFDVSLNLGHDLIDPSQPDQKVDIVYPGLIDLCSE
jgi:carboxylesterase